MKKVKVLVGWSLPAPLMERIRSADPRVHLLNDPAAELPRPAFGPPFPFLEDLLPLLREAEVLFTSRLPSGFQGRAPHIRWVQLLSAGADVALTDGLKPAHISFTTAVGVHPVQVSEWVIGAMLSLVKGFPQALRAQARREYWQYVPGELAGRTVGILGLGTIGRRIGYLCKALDMRVLGMRRSVTTALEGQDETDLMLPPQDLPRILRESDFLVVCLPRTQETTGLLGAKEIQGMKRGAYLVNIGRGGIVDEQALVQALRAGHLAGAALDVFAHEPLPQESPLWNEPKVLLTAHVAGSSPRYEERATELFLDNLSRYLGGRELRNVYDPDRGY